MNEKYKEAIGRESNAYHPSSTDYYVSNTEDTDEVFELWTAEHPVTESGIRIKFLASTLRNTRNTIVDDFIQI